MPTEKVVLAAADIAESVLHVFENAYPNDSRPRKAIEAARKGDKDTAYAAALAASAAACNASYAAYDAANAAALAASAAACNAYDAAYDAAFFAALVADRIKQEKLIRTIILKYWR
jgi:hypothetical protein